MKNSISTIKLVDKLIFIFFIIFLLSLTNSIFINQIGYFGALILILIRYFISKENQFSKTGLEIAFILFILAEFISAVFSDHHAPAFTNAIKRSLLIPIVYTTIVASVNYEKAKIVFKVYIGASLISVCIYLYFAYQHYLENLYGLTQSGPSIFQYPITASEIISFTVVFLFAFVLNEKTNIKTKLFLILAFALSMISLLSTYKRTGWTGAAFGIFIILVTRKQWKILIAGFAILFLIILLEKNESIVRVIHHETSKIQLVSEINTDGRAYEVYPYDKEKIIVSDYENGLVMMKDTHIFEKIQTPAPVISFTFWRNNFYIAQLIDTRFLLIKDTEHQLKIVDEFISPGYTIEYKVLNGYLYVVDSDSGLTIFKDPGSIADTIRIAKLKDINNIFADSSKLIIRSNKGIVSIVELVDLLPTLNIILLKFDESFDLIYYSNSRIFGFNANGIKMFELTGNKLNLLDENKRINKVYKLYSYNNKLFVMTTEAKLFEINLLSDKEIQIVSETKIDFLPVGFCYHNGNIILTKIKTSRLLSIFDPYNPTNLSRFALWRGGIEIFKDYPLFGVGDIGIENYYREYKRPFDKEIHGHLHNNFFHILATTGLFGLLAVCFMFFKIIQINIKIYYAVKSEKFISSYALGVIGVFCAFLVSGLTELNFGDQEIITLVWFTFGLNIAFFKSIKRI